ncbi:MAG: tRNA lysidine(34) synthetase TilS [Proteiniphilum sp.]|nr:tRNA lysidine(34) synthetase TilS [Proteiniphilum sp.]
MLDKVKRYIADNKLFEQSDKLLVGLSGGADSMALLNVLIELKYDCFAAHCNFHLRGEESDKDQLYVEDWCNFKNIPLITVDFDTTKYAADNKISIEMAARELRYRWFERVRKDHDADYIAVGHHLNDSIETFLLNLIRGTGISGLSGIAPKNGRVVRPLLSVSREEIEEYLDGKATNFRVDSTNLEDIYTRNFVRLNLLPSLEKINPSINDAIARTSKNLSEVEKVYRHVMEKDIKVVLLDNVIDIEKLKQTISPQSVLFEILFPLGFSPSSIEDVLDSIDATPGKVFYSPSHRLIKDRISLLIDELSTNEVENRTFTINKGNTHIDLPLDMSFDVKPYPVDITKSPKYLYLDADLITYPLVLRKWQLGDWFVPFGMKGRKKLSDFFTDQKFSIKDKEDVWILVSGEDIVWVVGHRSDDRFRVTPKTKNVLVINI